MSITRLDKIRIWCQKVLPTVYDDSLSYYEVLCKLKDIMNVMIENQMEMADNLDELNQTVIKSINLNGVTMLPTNNNVNLPTLAHEVVLNGESRVANGTGKINLPNLAETVNVSGESVNANEDGIVNLPNLTKNISVNSDNYPANASGNISLPNLAESVTINGTNHLVNGTGDVSINGIATSATVDGQTINATNGGNIALPNLLKKVTVDGVEYTSDSNGNVSFNTQASTAGVQSFNSRTGTVLPASGDYNAGQITYNNAISGLSADDVKEALDELKALLDVLSASDISYNNTTSGLTADDVQEAIDELKTLISSQTAGVSSFNSRTGAVVPASGDYSANQVSYNGTSIGLSSTDVSGAITELNSKISQAGGGTVTSVNASASGGLTVSGAPITSSGTLAIGVESGKTIPTDAKITNWDSAYSDVSNATDQATPYAIAKRNSSGDIIVNAVYGKLYGTANRAVADANGDSIIVNYLKKADTIRIVASATAPADTSVIWIDTSASANANSNLSNLSETTELNPSLEKTVEDEKTVEVPESVESEKAVEVPEAVENEAVEAENMVESEKAVEAENMVERPDPTSELE